MELMERRAAAYSVPYPLLAREIGRFKNTFTTRIPENADSRLLLPSRGPCGQRPPTLLPSTPPFHVATVTWAKFRLGSMRGVLVWAKDPERTRAVFLQGWRGKGEFPRCTGGIRQG